MPVIDTRLIQEGVVEVGHQLMKRSVDHTVLEALAVVGTSIFGAIRYRALLRPEHT
ncbi:uncharacterized protein GLRG_06504 [Colletotrichum graminicola M1.001]|uniref:Uncharacterized protein n=1 Tax=Colletotrichum graminicola (strain M1.001 / M2 / FGSC 10212) TaxID=645133 RepID=E3QKH2_COLGM|nr:uncharacterized protein GLRG_06504 [Colletotrichum graminicola M1.001]EFQ31360.1 hypothetical protein GLRG_06504 [Colletotrichum graminicola M1.001]